MSNIGLKGIDVLQTGNEIVFTAFLQTSGGALVTTGTTNLYLMEVQSDGTINTYDWSSNTFKSGAVTTEAQAMTYRKSNNATTDTGLWTFSLSTLTGFTIGAVYLMRVNNSNAGPTDQMRKFQYGGEQGDLLVTQGSTGQGYLQDDVREILGTASQGTAGYVGIDWSAIHAASTGVDLSGTTIHGLDTSVTVTGNVTVGGYATGEDPATLVLGAAAASWNTSGTIGAKINTAAGYAFPANFASMGITAAGAVAVDGTSPMAESYAAPGAPFTLAQGLYEAVQTFTQFAIAGTTITVQKRDRVTAALTFSLDSATQPTLRSRAT